MKGFDRGYFESVYGGEYARRNPPRKIRRYLREISEVKPEGDLLDIGCAYGLFISAARERYRVMGYDVSAHAIEEARRAFPGVEFRQCGIEDMSPGRAFDVVTCFDVLEHVRDLDTALERIRGFLKAGGVLALTVPVYDTPAGLVVSLLDRDETHVWKKGRRFWQEKLREHGFSIIKKLGFWRYYLPGGHYVFFGGTLWWVFSPAIMLIGGKMRHSETGYEIPNPNAPASGYQVLKA